MVAEEKEDNGDDRFSEIMLNPKTDKDNCLVQIYLMIYQVTTSSESEETMAKKYRNMNRKY